jgi:hypothetical protein
MSAKPSPSGRGNSVKTAFDTRRPHPSSAAQRSLSKVNVAPAVYARTCADVLPEDLRESPCPDHVGE